MAHDLRVVVRYSSALAAAFVLAVLSQMSVSAGVPSGWSPFNLVVVLPAFLSYELLRSTSASLFFGTLVVPIFFLVWTYPATWLDPAPPKRTVVLSFVLVVLSAFSIVFGYSYGLEYQGDDYVSRVSMVSIACWTGIVSLAVLAMRNKTRAWNVAFHLLFFGWLAWYAIPYMGELP